MKEYDAVIGGIKHTFQLSDADAKLRGLDPAKDGRAVKQGTAPANKAAAPAGDK